MITMGMYVTGFAKRGLICTIIDTFLKYSIQECTKVFACISLLIYSIQDHLVDGLFSGKLAEVPAILCSFIQLVNTISLYRGGG